MKPKRELIRVVRSPEGEIALDFRGKNPDAVLISARMPSALPKQERKMRWEMRSAVKFRTRYMTS